MIVCGLVELFVFDELTFLTSLRIKVSIDFLLLLLLEVDNNPRLSLGARRPFSSSSREYGRDITLLWEVIYLSLSAYRLGLGLFPLHYMSCQHIHGPCIASHDTIPLPTQ
jgi:hypothetical protein